MRHTQLVQYIFLLLLCAKTFSIPACNYRICKFYSISKDHVLITNDDLIIIVSSPNAFRCASYCCNQSSCKSINYYPGRCELLTVHVEVPSKLAFSNTGSYYEVHKSSGVCNNTNNLQISNDSTTETPGYTGNSYSDCINSSYSEPVDIPPFTDCYVGISTGVVPKSSFSASSFQELAHFSQLGCKQAVDIGGWFASGVNDWILVDLTAPFIVYGIITQGGACSSTVDCSDITHDGSSGYMYYITSFRVEWTIDLLSSWSSFLNPSNNSQVFAGNIDNTTPLINWFANQEIAVYVKVTINTFSNSPALRFELLNCSSGDDSVTDALQVDGSVNSEDTDVHDDNNNNDYNDDDDDDDDDEDDNHGNDNDSDTEGYDNDDANDDDNGVHNENDDEVNQDDDNDENNEDSDGDNDGSDESNNDDDDY
ncbi:uncharacterized protein DDB_G0283357-like [Anneissia japonica]|uniref:uncharacterized protein DDB_G0283357-like n=1 Tax=Anneissia japonica TaxID=1529436 RepID=UPI001425897A|nr:uncharacterized protein DDB_G0283357-like [Anneissia japonica]